MNLTSRDRIKRLLPFMLIAFVLVIALSLLLEGFVREFFVIPLTFLTWILGLIYRSISQDLLWAFLVLVVLIVAFRVLTWQEKKRQGATLKKVPITGSATASVQVWLERVRSSQRGETLGGNLSPRLTMLLHEFLAFRSRIGRGELNKLIGNKDLEVPPRVQAWFQTVEEMENARMHSRRTLVQWARELLQGPNKHEVIMDEKVLWEVIEYLENELEVKDEHNI